MLSSIGSRAAADPEELHFRREARSRFVRPFLRYPAALPALILFVIVVLCALGAPLLTQYTPFEGNAAERLQGIGTAGHLLGTDEQGRDILTRCLYGGRLSLLMGFLPVALATIVGSILGIISGYFGKAYAQIIMRTLDIFYAFPSILLAIALSSVLGSGLSSIIILLYHAIQRQHPVGLWLELSGIGHFSPHAGMGLHAERPAAADLHQSPDYHYSGPVHFCHSPECQYHLRRPEGRHGGQQLSPRGMTARRDWRAYNEQDFRGQRPVQVLCGKKAPAGRKRRGFSSKSRFPRPGGGGGAGHRR